MKPNKTVVTFLLMTAATFPCLGELAPPSDAVAAKPESSVTSVAMRSGKGGLFFNERWPEQEDAKGQVEVGLKFYVEKSGILKSFWFYQACSESGAHVFHLWSSDGTPLLSVTAQESIGQGWMEIPLPAPFPVVASTQYILSYTSNSNYVGTPDIFTEPVKRDGIMAVAGLYSFGDLGRKAPAKTYKDMNYFLDLTYEPTK